MKRIVAVLAVTLLLAGCITVGRDFPAGPVSRIENAGTTREEIRSMFGDPYQTGVEDGLETWTYVWVRYGGKAASKELHLKFTPDGTVSTYSYSSSIPREGK